MGATLEHVRAALPHGESTSLPARLPACRHPRSRRACLSAWRGVQVRMLDESLEREGMRLDDAALRSDELVAIVRRYGVPPLHNIFNMCVCVRVCACARVCVPIPAPSHAACRCVACCFVAWYAPPRSH
jgi:hypothetical protein